MATCGNCGEPCHERAKWCRRCQDTMRKIKRLQADERQVDAAAARVKQAIDNGEHLRRPEYRADAQWADPPWEKKT